MYPKAVTALVTTAAALAGPAAAQAEDLHVGPRGFGSLPSAANTLVGLTSQSPCDMDSMECGVVNVTPAPNGRSIKQVLVGWEATCEQPGMAMEGVAVARALKIKRARTGSSFRLARRYLVGAGDGYFARVDDRFTGTLDKRGRTARGTYSAVAVVIREGQQVDRCVTGTITWKAQRLK